MSRVVVGVLLTAGLLGQTFTARAAEPVPVPPTEALVPVAAPATTPCPPAQDVAAEQRAFEREMALFARRYEFTQRLLSEREARAFEEAEARYVRFAELTRKLAAQAAAEAERQFEFAVAEFVKKRELTRTLSRVPSPPAPARPPEPALGGSVPSPAVQ